jgi:hypothetical protein
MYREAVVYKETEGHRELDRQGVLPNLDGREWPGRCDLYCGGQSVPPAWIWWTILPITWQGLLSCELLVISAAAAAGIILNVYYWPSALKSHIPGWVTSPLDPCLLPVQQLLEEAVVFTEAEGRRVLDRQDVLPDLDGREWPGRCDLHRDGQSLPLPDIPYRLPHGRSCSAARFWQIQLLFLLLIYYYMFTTDCHHCLRTGSLLQCTHAFSLVINVCRSIF